MSDKICNTPECSFNGVMTKVESVKIDVEFIKKNQERFELKQDKMIDAISNHKAILEKLDNIKENQDKYEDRLNRFEDNVRGDKTAIYQKLNELETKKAEKDDTKETRSWLWGLVIAGLFLIINWVWDLIKSGNLPKVK